MLDTDNGQVLETSPTLGEMLRYTAEEMGEVKVHYLAAHPR